MGVVKGEFPFLQLSPSMARQLWKKQLRQVKQLSRPLTCSNPTKKVHDVNHMILFSLAIPDTGN